MLYDPLEPGRDISLVGCQNDLLLTYLPDYPELLRVYLRLVMYCLGELRHILDDIRGYSDMLSYSLTKSLEVFVIGFYMLVKSNLELLLVIKNLFDADTIIPDGLNSFLNLSFYAKQPASDLPDSDHDRKPPKTKYPF